MSEKTKQLTQKELPELRDSILKKQDFKCIICKRIIEDPVLDHHHTKRIGGTGKIRGVLCRSCNVFLAKSENNSIRYCIAQNDLPRILRNMADYLEKEQYNILHPTEKPKEPKLKKSSYKKLVKAINNKQKIPEYPKSGNLTKQLKLLYEKYNIKPEFYKE